MLVLNTNSGNGGFTLTNENILMSYPDPKQILIAPLGNIDVNGKLTIETVNGTPIHQIAGQFCFPQYYENVAENNNGWSGGYTMASITNNLTRIATPSSLEGGELVGKTIVYPNVLSLSATTALEYKVGLLHTDGTITYIGTHTCDLTKKSPSYIGSTIQASGSNVSLSEYYGSGGIAQSEGVVASVGDRIIVEYIGSGGGSSGYNQFCCCFGKPCTQNPQARINFFQISIE